MKKCKGFCGVLMLLFSACLLSGCGYKETVSVDVAAKSVTAELEVYFSEEELKLLGEVSEEDLNTSELTKVILNGKTYYKTSQKQTIKPSELKQNSIVMDSHKYIQYISASDASAMTDEEMQGLMPEFMEVTYHFTKRVIDTNGTLLADGMSVSVNPLKLKGSCFYATFDNTASKAKTVTFSGVKNKGCYNKAKTIQLKTDGIVTDILVNGKSAPGESYYDGKKLNCNYVTLSKDGTYKVTAVLSSGAKKTVTVTIDKKQPTTNLKNNKTYKRNVKVTFTDKTSGIKKAVLNGKKIKSGYKIRKKGTYKLVLTDKAGNTKTVKFKVK